MAFELINQGPVTPHRLQALIRLMGRKEAWKRQEILDLVQPTALDTSQSIAKETLRAATSLELVGVDGEYLVLTMAAKEPMTIEAFRQWLAAVTSGARTDSSPNYRFNLFTAWYATLDDEVLRTGSSELVIRFNERMPSETDERIMNTTKYNAWRTLAAFLGYGWVYGGRLIPDATVRLRPLLTDLLPEFGLVPVGNFLSQLATYCPELDGGDLFRMSRQHDRTAQSQRRLSLMLSSALRRFASDEVITLSRLPDARETWRLFPASGFPLDEVTHISRGGLQ